MRNRNPVPIPDHPDELPAGLPDIGELLFGSPGSTVLQNGVPAESDKETGSACPSLLRAALVCRHRTVPDAFLPEGKKPFAEHEVGRRFGNSDFMDLSLLPDAMIDTFSAPTK